MKAVVIVPTYNERSNIAAILGAVLSQGEGVEILIVDDNSPDGTARVVEDAALSDNRIHLMSRPGKMGLGTAYTDGFKWALERDYDYILEMDADFSHNPADIPRLIEACKTHDLSIGSRYIRGVNVVNWPLRRLLLSWGASQYVHFITGMPIKDPTGGFKCFRRELLQKIDLNSIRSNGYSFQIEMNYRAWLKGAKIKEVSIVFTERLNGVSKMNSKIVREAIFMVWKLRWLALNSNL